MLKSTRRKLFYALVAIFLVIGAGIVFYAQGWRFDFAKWQPEKVGEIYIRAYPMDAAVAVNGKPIKSQIGFLTHGTLVPDLLPGTYSVALNETGYHAWREAATVAATLVTEFKYAVLIPQSGTVVSTTSAKNFALTANGPIIQTARGTSLHGSLIDPGMISASNPLLSPFMTQRASGNLVLRDPAASTTINLANIFSANGIAIAPSTRVLLDPYNANKVAAISPVKFALLDLPTQAVTAAMAPATGISFTSPFIFSPSGAAWTSFNAVKNISRVYFYDIGLATSSISSSTIIGKTRAIAWIAGSDFAVVQSDGELYDYNTDSQIFTKRADAVTNVAVSSDGTMLAALEPHSIEIFALNTQNTQSYWRFNLPENNTIKNLTWYHDDHHLFVTYPDHVSFLDLSDTNLFNFTTIANGTSPEYDESENALYLLSSTSSLVKYSFPG